MPSSPRDWSDPFLEQARADLRAAYAVQNTGCPSTFCMLLQMVFEKLAKAAYTRTGNPFPKSHQACRHLFFVLRRSPAAKDILTGIQGVESFIYELEAAQPAVAKSMGSNTPQLEYPWEDQSGIVRTPEFDLGIAKRVSNPRDLVGPRCLQFASRLEQNLWTIIP